MGHFSKDIDKARRINPGKAYIYEAMEKRMKQIVYCFMKMESIFVEIGSTQGIVQTIKSLEELPV